MGFKTMCDFSPSVYMRHDLLRRHLVFPSAVKPEHLTQHEYLTSRYRLSPARVAEVNRDCQSLEEAQE